jgi:hypothetical protein
MADEPTTTTEPTTPEPQTFSADYVRELRDEAARYRTRASEIGAKLRKALGLEPDADCSDLDALLMERDAQMESAALKKANDRLITAEIRSLTGYDMPLLERLIDRSGIAVGDDGAVTGVAEAAEAVSKQFPAAKKAQQEPPKWSPSNPAPSGTPEKKPNEMTFDEFAASLEG